MYIDISKLKGILEEEFPEILFAFLFGSSKDGSVRDGGDVDIAVWINDVNAKMNLIPRIIGVVESISNGSACDLIFLNDSGSQLAFEVLQGRILFIRDEAMELYSGFYSETCRKYEDEMFWMKRQLQYRGYEVQW